MASTILIDSPTPDGVFLVWNENFSVDCIQQIEQGEPGSVAHLQFGGGGLWLTCRPASGAVQCSPRQWSPQLQSFSILDVQIKVLGQQTIRVAIGTSSDPDNPGLTGLVSDERIVEGIRARTTWTESGKSADTSTEDATSSHQPPPSRERASLTPATP